MWLFFFFLMGGVNAYTIVGSQYLIISNNWFVCEKRIYCFIQLVNDYEFNSLILVLLLYIIVLNVKIHINTNILFVYFRIFAVNSKRETVKNENHV